MSESLAQKQVRLNLEQICASVCMRLLERFAPRCDVLLLVFDYGGGGEFDNVAFKTSLDRNGMIEILEARVRRWEAGAPTIFTTLEPGEWLPDQLYMENCAAYLREKLPDRLGFALFLGRGERSQYIAAGHRDDMSKMFTNDMLPRLRGER